MERPEHVDFILGLSHFSKPEVEYQITFRSWQLQELRDYIHHLEQNRKQEQQ